MPPLRSLALARQHISCGSFGLWSPAVRLLAHARRRHNGGPRKAAWALGQLRISRAHADRLRALRSRVIRPEADGLAAVIELFPQRPEKEPPRATPLE